MERNLVCSGCKLDCTNPQKSISKTLLTENGDPKIQYVSMPCNDKICLECL